MGCFDMMPFKKQKETAHLFKGYSWFCLLFFSPFLWEGTLFLLMLPSGHRKGISVLSQVLDYSLQGWGQSCVTTCTFSIHTGCAYSPLPVPVGFSPSTGLGYIFQRRKMIFYSNLSFCSGKLGRDREGKLPG